MTTAVLLISSTGRPAAGQMGGMSNGSRMMTWEPTLFVLFDQLDYAPAAETQPVNFDLLSWYGGSKHRMWVRSQGDFVTTRRAGEAEVQVLYGRLVDPWWDAVVGVRAERTWGPENGSRQFLTFGLVGLAPYRFQFAPTLFVSTKGEISARFEAGYEVLITQQLIAEPEIELNASLQDVPSFGIKRGLNEYEAGLRLRYEFRREFGPYVGVSRSRRGVASIAGGQPAASGAENRLVLGLRLWR